MSINAKLGAGYEAIRAAARFKTIKVNLNDVQFELRVRVPVKREMEAIQQAVASVDKALVDKLYRGMADPLLKTVEEAGEGFLDAINQEKQTITIKDDDIEVGGTSVRRVAELSAIWQTQVEKYFALLESQTGEPINETFDQISDEFPESVIKEIVGKIDEAIRPNYKDTKKN